MSQEWTENRIRSLIQIGETDLVDFKQQWYDFHGNEGKAEFARDMLAMVNTATSNRPGVIIVGVDDAGKIVGASARPTDEAIAQSLAANTLPPVAFTVAHVVVGTDAVDVIEVPSSKFRPHYATRNTGSLKCEVAYCRRGPTTGTLTLPEIIAMVRRFDLPLNPDPLEMGFVEFINWASGCMMARVVNRSEEPITGIHLVLEILPRFRPDLIRSRNLLVDATLLPRESREIKLEIIAMMEMVDMIVDGETLDPRSNLQGRWMDVTLHLVYRDRSGYFRSKREVIRLGD